MASNLCCPGCQSEETRKVSLLFEQGVSTGTTTSSTVGTGFNSGGFIASTSSTHSSQTALAQRLAPPPQKKERWGFFLFFGGILSLCIYGVVEVPALRTLEMGAVLLLLGLICVALILHLKKTMHHNKTAWRVAWNEWNSQYLCLRCNQVFAVK